MTLYYVMKLVGPAVDDFGRNVGRITSTPFDGLYVVEYDPSRDGIDPKGRSMNCHLIASPVKRFAKRYASTLALLQDYKRVDARRPVRKYDGQPNRPITVFTVLIETLDI